MISLLWNAVFVFLLEDPNWQTLDCHFTATQNIYLFLLMRNLWYKSTICKPGQWSRVLQSCIHMPSLSVQPHITASIKQTCLQQMPQVSELSHEPLLCRRWITMH